MKKLVTIPMHRAIDFCAFCESYKIDICLSWQHEDFLSQYIRAVVDLSESNGITHEEKVRLLNECPFIKPVNF